MATTDRITVKEAFDALETLRYDRSDYELDMLKRFIIQSVDDKDGLRMVADAWQRGSEAGARQAAPNAPVVTAVAHEASEGEAEIGEVRLVLRNLCKDFGDLEWDDATHLADVVSNHLGKHLREGFIAKALAGDPIVIVETGVYQKPDLSDPQVRAALALADDLVETCKGDPLTRPPWRDDEITTLTVSCRLLGNYISARDNRPKDPCGVAIFIDGERKYCSLPKHDRSTKHKLD